MPPCAAGIWVRFAAAPGVNGSNKFRYEGSRRKDERRVKVCMTLLYGISSKKVKHLFKHLFQNSDGSIMIENE